MISIRQFVSILAGIGFLSIGLLGITGVWKRWYWRSQRSVYYCLPLGIVAILLAFDMPISTALGENEWILTVIYWLLFGIAFWFILRPPDFLKPGWIRMIESHPPYVYEEMANQVKSGKEWRKIVAEEESLKVWIDEIERKGPEGK